MPQEAVVIEERPDGTKSVWNFARREKHELNCGSGLVGEWLHIDGDNSAPTEPTLSTTSVEVPPLPGKHVMLKVPAVRVPCARENQGDAASFDQPQCFWSPFLGAIHAFFDAQDIPQGVLLEVDVIKVCDPLKYVFEKKYGRQAEWMIRRETINEVNTATEDAALALLQMLGIERIEGVVIRCRDDSCTIAAELCDGSQKLFVACNSSAGVGDVVSFVPIEVRIDAAVLLAVSYRMSRPNFAKPLVHIGSQFLIPFSAFAPFGDHYRATYLGLVEDSKNVLKGGSRMPEHVIARIGTREGSFCMAVDIQLEQWTLEAICACVKGKYSFFEWFPKELAEYPSFRVSKKHFRDLTGIAPVPGQWYGMVVRFYATPEDFTGDRPTCVLSAQCIPKPPSAPEFVARPIISQEPLKSLEPKAVCPDAEGHPEQASSLVSVLQTTSPNTGGASSSVNAKLNAKLELEEQVLTASCTHKKGEDALFECTHVDSAERNRFHATVKCFQECTANNDPSPGQQYELTVRFYARATPSQAHILAAKALSGSSQTSWLQNDQASNHAVTSKQPPNAEISSGKAKFEPEERTLKAVCIYVKGDETFFEPVPKESAKYPIFQVVTKTFVEKTGCSEPVVGQLFMLMLKFSVRSAKATHVPRANVITATTLRKRLGALQFRRIEATVADPTSTQSPQVPVDDSIAATSNEPRLSNHTGVVCYKDRDACYVYSAQMGYEIPVDSLTHGLDAGDWVDFSVNNDDVQATALNPAPAQPRFPTTPVHHSVIVKCSIMVPTHIQDTDDTVMSNFVGNVRDVHGLVRTVSSGVHSATIRYVYEERLDRGLWQLEYVYANNMS